MCLEIVKISDLPFFFGGGVGLLATAGGVYNGCLEGRLFRRRWRERGVAAAWRCKEMLEVPPFVKEWADGATDAAKGEVLHEGDDLGVPLFEALQERRFNGAVVQMMGLRGIEESEVWCQCGEWGVFLQDPVAQSVEGGDGRAMQLGVERGREAFEESLAEFLRRTIGKGDGQQIRDANGASF